MRQPRPDGLAIVCCAHHRAAAQHIGDASSAHMGSGGADGGHDPDGLGIACRAHQRAAAPMWVRTSAACRLPTWGPATRTLRGGGLPEPRSDGGGHDPDGLASASCANGFKETESRRAIAEARARVGPDASVEELLRAALGAAASRVAG